MSKLTRTTDGVLSYESGEPEKAKTPRKRTPVHRCSEKAHLEEMTKAIEQIRLWLAGNHDPENGVIYKMIDTIKAVDVIKGDISLIKTQLTETIIAANTAASSLERYKIEVNSFDAGKDNTETKRKQEEELKSTNDRKDEELKMTKARDKRFMTFQIISMVLIMAGLIWSIINK